MKKALKSKASVVVIFVSKVHGLGRFELCLGIMKDMKPHTLNLLPDIISVVMVAAGGQYILTFHKTQFVVNVSFLNYLLDHIQSPVIFTKVFNKFDFVFQRQGWLLLAYREG